MHQSRKEQGIERAGRSMLTFDRREAAVMAHLESSIEAAEEWAGTVKHGRPNSPGSLS
ncbi:hypothetical protein ACFO9Q_06920 [Paenibacillus sp. GCM10023252]|uniref:hypothetical protein n=1 Tax=Paenibacillus sp. GCM10023252 TaxID=3252649 RepID=UPI003613E6DE